MKKQFFRVVLCAVLIAAFMVQAAGASEIDGIDTTAPSTATESKGSEKYPFSKIKSRIKKYKEVNEATQKEVIGWLTVTGTNINTPVNFSSKNNKYYEKRDWQGTNYPDLVYSNWNKKPATANYLDYRVKLGETWKSKGASKNIVVYGHNWNNLKDPLFVGPREDLTMFAQLPSYTNKDFAKNNPYIYFSTDKQEGIWKVFAVAYSELNPKFPYNSPNLNKEDFSKLIKEWKKRSMFNFDTEVTDTDRIITLSTCTRQYNMGEYQRFVVVARLLRNGESENDKVKVSVNTEMKKPQF